MVDYLSSEDVKSGIPLGGIGAGKIEIFPNGTLDNCNHQNNWEFPLNNKTLTNLNMNFSIYVEADKRKIVRLLSTKPVRNCSTIEKIHFTGRFPIAELVYVDKELPIEVLLTAFYSFIPGDYKNSGLPIATFKFLLRNPTDKPLNISLMIWAMNTIGDSPIGRYNEVKREGGLVGIIFHTKNPLSTDVTVGNITLATSETYGEVSYLGEWNYYREPTCAWEHFSQEGVLPNTNTKGDAQGDAARTSGALAVRFTLSPNEEKIIPFYYGWFTPNHHIGHIYENWFKDSWNVVGYMNNNWTILLEKTEKWQKVIKESNIPGWLKDALINNLYVLVSSSWWGRDNCFAIWESAVDRVCPLMSTTDLRYYYSIPLALLFPEFERTEMKEYIRAQRPNGYIPHDLGRSRIDSPSDGTSSPPQWKDLCPNFILMGYRDYLWSEDEEFLMEIYPAVKRAMKWEFSTDGNRDYLPDNEGGDQTFDNWSFHGVHAYSASIFLASLRAGEKMANFLNDKEFMQECRFWFEKGSINFEKKLWNGKYYLAARGDNGKIYNACIAGQLSGQWYAHMLDLGYLLPKEHVKSAVKTMCDLNGKSSMFGAVNSVFPTKERDISSNQSQSIWPGISYSLAALAIYEGLVEEGLEIARKTWLNFTENIKSPWNQSDEVYPEDGSLGYGDHYPRNMSIWSVLFALAKQNQEVAKIILDLKKQIKNV